MRQGSPRLAVAAFLALLLLAAPAAAQDRTWAAPVDVSAGTDQRAAPNVLFAPDRTAHALWFEIVGGAAVLRHAQRPLGGAWSQPVTVSEAGVYQQSTIEAGIDQDGDLTVAWSRDDVIEAKTKPSGGPWPATADVLSDAADTTTPGGVPMNPDVAVAPGGQAVVVWEQSGKILAARRPEGGTWDRTQIGANGASPSVGLDGDGAAVVIWPGVVQGAPDREYVGTNQMSAGGAWGTAGELPGTSYDDNSALYISVELAVSATGDAFAIWDMNRTQAGVAGGIDPVEGAIRPAGGAWTTPHTLAPGDHENNDNQGNLPRIATDPLGNAAAVFYEGPPNNLAVRAVDATAAGWGTPATIAPAGATSLNDAPAISVSPQGDALAAWPRSGHIDGAERLLGEPWPGTPEPISDPAGGTASAPRLAHDPSGDGMAVWATDTPAGSAVQSSLRDVPDQAPVVVPGPSGGGDAGTPPVSTAGPGPDLTDPSCIAFERLIGPLVARAACFRSEGALLMSRTPVRINGIDIVPASEADRILLDPGSRQLRVVSPSGAGRAIVKVGSIPLYRGTIDIDLREPFQLPLNQAASAAGLRLSGQAGFSLQPGGAEIDVRVRLADPLPIDVQLTIPTTLQGLAVSEMRFVSAYQTMIRRLLAAPFRAVYDPALNRWVSDTRVVLPGMAAGRTLASRLEFQGPVPTYLHLKKDGPDVPMIFGVLRSLDAEMFPRGNAGRGTIKLSAGRTLGGTYMLELDGTATMTPERYEGGGSLEFARLMKVEPVAFSWITGAFSYRGAFSWQVAQPLDFGPFGHFNGISVSGSVAGASAPGTQADFSEGSVSLHVGIAGLSGSFVLTSNGAAACAPVTVAGVAFRVGFAVRFSPYRVAAYTGACDVGSLKTAANASAAGARRTVTLRRGLPSAMLAVRGREAPPKVDVRGPGGRRAATRLFENPRDRTTYVFVARPAPGTWRVVEQQGSAAVASVRVAEGLRPASVSGRVTRARSRRVLRWRLRPIAGQRVRFLEVGKGVSRTLTTTRRRRGTLRFTPSIGPAGTRKIVAVVEQRGTVRTSVTVARFRTATVRAATPRRLRATRRGKTLRITWRGTAPKHVARITLSDGRRIVRVLGRQRRIDVRAVAAKTTARIRIAGLDAMHREGRAGALRVRAKR